MGRNLYILKGVLFINQAAKVIHFKSTTSFTVLRSVILAKRFKLNARFTTTYTISIVPTQ